MAKIVGTQVSQTTAAAASFTASLPPHITGDLLLVFVVQDGGTGTFSFNAGTTGWAFIGTQAAGGSIRSIWAYKVAASGAEASPIIDSTLSDDWTGSALAVRYADTGVVYEGTPAKVDSSAATTHVSGAVTSSTNGGLVLTGWGMDCGSTVRTAKTLMSAMRCASKSYGISNGVSHAIGYKLQETAGSTGTVTAYQSTSCTGQSWSIVIPDATSGGSRQPDIVTSIEELRWYGDFGTHDATTTWQSPGNFPGIINATECVNGTQYNIQVVGTTDFTLIGAANNNVGTIFTATGAGTGTGTVSPTVNGYGFSAVISQAATVLQTDLWGSYAGLTSLETYESLCGGSHTISSTDFTNKIFSVTWTTSVGSTSAYAGSLGVLVGFSDGTNFNLYQVNSRAKAHTALAPQTAFIDLDSATPYATSGTLNKAAITRVGYFYHRTPPASTAQSVYVKNATLFSNVAIIGGGTPSPATFVDYHNALNSWNGLEWSKLQGSAQVLGKSPIQVGNGGTNVTVFDSSASSLEFPPAWSATSVTNWQMDWNVGVNALTVGVYGGASDNITVGAGVIAAAVEQDFTIHASASTSGTYSFTGESIVGKNVTWKTGIPCTGVTFSQCDEIAFKGASITNCTIKKTTSTDAACSWDADGATVTGTTIDVTSTSAAYHLELGTAVTAITLADVTFTGTPTTDKVHVRKTTGTVTITISGTTTLAAGDVTTEGATVSIVAPTLERGISFTGLQTGTSIQVFTSGTQTKIYGDDSTAGSTFAFDDATAGSITVDYTIQKAGYLPQRVTGQVLTGAVGTGQIDVSVTQIVDRAYAASSGLTYGTTAVVTVGTNPTTNPGTKTFTLSAASTGQNWYSFWIEQWIDKGNATGEALANVTFPLAANGPNSFTLLNGWEFSDGATSIAFLSRDGLRYLNASSVLAASWAAILTAGVPSGARVRYQQVEGTTESAVVTSGNMDELIQIYGDATHGNFDYRGYLVLKVQESGYDQIESDAIALYGNLEDQLYVVGLAPTANGVATGDPALTITITDHGASPVTWNGKDFSITIIDNATPSTGTNIMRELRHNFEAGGTYQGKDGFNWHDLVQTNGSDFKTVRGSIYGDVGATLKGVRVVQNDGSTAHTDFTLFTADDGTTYAPPPAATITVGPFTSGSRVQLYDTANSAELFNDIVAATSKVYSETYSVDRTIRVRISYVSGATAKEFIEATVGNITSGAPDISYTSNQVDDDTYNDNAIDGPAVYATSGITFTDASPDRVNCNIAGGAVTYKTIYACFVYWNFTATGIANDFTYIEAPDTANYILSGMKIRNTSATALSVTGGWGRDATTGASVDIIDTAGSTGNVFLAPDHVIAYATGSGVTAQDITDIAAASATAVDSALTNDFAAIPAAVLTAADANPIASNVKEVNDVVITGTGIEETDEWRPA